MRWLAVLLMTTYFLQKCLAANILAICCIPSHSHALWCYKYMAALAERGHQITVLGLDNPKFEIANLTTFIDTTVYDSLLTIDMSMVNIFGENSKIRSMLMLKAWNEAGINGILKSKAIKDLMNKYGNVKRPFDLIIHDDGGLEALLGLVPFFGNPPLLLATTYGSPHWMPSRLGNILNPAYVPTMMASYNQHMTFLERCQNTFYYIFLEFYSKYLVDPYQDKLMREVFGHDLPPVREIAKRSIVVIVNYNFALNDPRPLLPGVIGIAGLHISPPKQLPQYIKDFMDGAESGVILISFGSNLNSEWLPKELTNIIIESVRPLPQRVLWKWDKNVPNVPENIKISDWLPQSDIMAHPNLKLFVTHCGLLSTQEAVYHKKPILALPVFLDQIENAERMVKRNITKMLELKQLTVKNLQNGIKEILLDPMYKTNIEKLGELMVDMPQTAKQQAVFWTEYVIRHQGAAHLRSAAADMPWHQILLLDVLAAFITVLLLVFVILKKIVVFILKMLNCSNKKFKAE